MWLSGPACLFFPAASPKPAGAPGGPAVLSAAAGQGGRAHGGEESAELGGDQHVPAVRDRAEHGGRGAGTGERAGAPVPIVPAGVPMVTGWSETPHGSATKAWSRTA